MLERGGTHRANKISWLNSEYYPTHACQMMPGTADPASVGNLAIQNKIFGGGLKSIEHFDQDMANNGLTFVVSLTLPNFVQN